jgi:hypothetical protein
MTIDTNTVLMTLMGAITIYFAYGFFKSRLNDKFEAVTRRIDKVEEAMWHENDRVNSRINDLLRMCRENSCNREYPVKNHYNTEA